MLIGSHPYLCNGAGVIPSLPVANGSSQNVLPATTTTVTTPTANNKNAAGSATDFSIAAIMAREDASSRESSLRSASK